MKQAICVFVYNIFTRQVLLVNRRGEDAIGLPGGKVDPGETHIEAAIRELYEETGLLVPIYSPHNCYKGICHGEDIFEVTCYYTSIMEDDIPQGNKPGITARWGDASELLTNSPFAEWNKQMLESIGYAY